jgi:hypothetical protein
MYIEVDELRAIIEGKRVYRKCPRCNGEGTEYYKWADDNQTGEVSFVTSQEYWDNENNPMYGHAECENCESLGYVIGILEPD